MSTLAWLGCGSTQDDETSLDAAGRPASAGSRGVTLGMGGSSGASGGGGNGSGGTVTAAAGEGGQPNDRCESLAGLDQCGGTKLEAEPAPVHVLLVIDKSGSMVDVPNGFALDKWSAMKEALGAALSSAPPSVSFGLLLYPDAVFETIPLDCEGELCCNVPASETALRVRVQPGRESAIEEALESASPGGGTPTAAALDRAYEYFTQGDGSTLAGDRYVLLATDGGPNCNPELACDASDCTPNLDGAPQCAGANCCAGAGEFCLDHESVTARIEALRAEGIATFVVGIPGSETYATHLDAFARAGGVPRQGSDRDYFAVSAASGASGLSSVLTSITTELLRSCEIELPERPAQPSLVNVAIDCRVLPQDDESGWDFDDPTAPSSLIVRGRACEELKSEGARRIDVVYGCTTIR